MRKKNLLVILSIVLALSLFSVSAKGDTRYDTIYRGQTKAWFLDPGDVLTVYYYADGRECTVTWKNNWYYWWSTDSFSTINIYCRYNSWYHMYVDSFAPYYRKLPLRVSGRGIVYKFVIKNYREGDMVYLKIY